MATKIPIGTSAYFTDFAGGQGGGASNYFTYAEDHDTNYSLLRSTVNQMIDEISAVSGPNATIALDLSIWNDDANPISPPGTNNGVLGPASYEVIVEGGGTLKIRKGQVLIGGQKAELVADLTGVTSSGVAGTRWVALDANGVVFIEALAAQKAVDVASVQWNGTIFTGSPTYLIAVFFDGDSWAEMQNRPVKGTTFPAKVFRHVNERIEDIEDTISAGTGGGAKISAPPGSAALPGLIFNDGAGTEDTTSGWYRAAANVWAFATSAVSRLRLTAQGILAAIDGSAAAPFFSWVSDPDSGLYRKGANDLGISTAGNEALEITSLGQVTMPLQGVVIVSRSTAQTITTSTPTLITFDTEEIDRTGWVAVPATTLTVPTGFAGVYIISAYIEWNETGGGANVGDRRTSILINATEVVALREDSAKSGSTKQPVTTAKVLSDGDTVTLQVFQDSGSNRDVDAARLGALRLN